MTGYSLGLRWFEKQPPVENVEKPCSRPPLQECLISFSTLNISQPVIPFQRLYQRYLDMLVAVDYYQYVGRFHRLRAIQKFGPLAQFEFARDSDFLVGVSRELRTLPRDSPRCFVLRGRRCAARGPEN